MITPTARIQTNAEKDSGGRVWKVRVTGLAEGGAKRRAIRKVAREILYADRPDFKRIDEASDSKIANDYLVTLETEI